MATEILCIIIGLIIGFLIIRITSPAPKIILKTPTLDNISDTIYVDENGTRYKYYAKEVSCT